jgi:hypothetical protein
MRSSWLRWLSRLGSLLVLGLGLAAPVSLHAAPKVVAHPGPPSSLSAIYGQAVPQLNPSIRGPYVIPTGTGFEIRDAALPAADPVGVWRAPGVIHDVAYVPQEAYGAGYGIYVFAGAQGIAMVDITTPSLPVLIGSRVDPTPAVLGAAVETSGLVVSDGASLQLYRRTFPPLLGGPPTLVPLTPITYADGRQVVAIRARADSFLVASARSAPGARIFLTLYQLPSGATAAVQLREVQVPLQTPSDLAWKDDLAFVAAGSGGVVVANMRTGAFHTTALPSNRAVLALDVNDSLVVAGVAAKGLAKYRRSGALGDTLGGYTVESLGEEPTHVTLVGTRAIIATQDVITPSEPDEVGRSLIEVRDIDVPIAVAPAGGTGRVRRVVTAGGYAYVADYLGGLRVYRSGVSDSSLVGVLPTPLAAGVLDLAVDAAHGRAYLASSAGGLQVVDISDPASPTLLATLLLAERAFTVAVVDSNTVIVGGRGSSFGGATLVDVSIPSAPAPLGHLLLEDPRAIAVKDTVAFVADALQGVVSVGVGTPTNPTMIGEPSGIGAEDVDLTGNLLLVATRTAGLQIVDATVPTLLTLRSTLPLPRMFGVAGSGQSALALLGDDQAAVIDLSNSFQPVIRGPVMLPGFARDASWVGDTVLVAADYSLERLLIVPAEQNVPALVIALDAGRPIAHISWDPVVRPNMVGLRLYRDVLAPLANPGGESVNGDLLPPSATTAVDTLAAGITVRYRLEAVLMDGSSIEVARSTATIPSSASVGHPYPNPFRPGGSLIVTVPLANGVANLRVTIHDARGRLVRRIELPGLSSSGSGGFQQVTWDGRDGAGRIVPSGVYFMALEGQGLSDAKRIVVLR